MTVKELKEKAKQMGLGGYSKLRKAELEKFIEDNTLHNSEILFSGECSGDGEWLKHRKIGATETSILVVDNAFRHGLINRPDKYNSPYLIYLERKGLYKRDISFASQVAMEFGHYAEDFIIAHLPALFKNEFNIEVQETKKGNQVVGSKEYPLWSCTPDSWVKIENEWYPVELKTGNSFTSYEWEREEVPNKYFAQVQQQLAVLGKEKGFLVGFVDNRFTRVYEIDKDKKLINEAYELTKKFQECLEKNIEPELNGCEMECDFLKEEFKGFGNPLEQIPSVIVDYKELDTFTSLQETKKITSTELKEIEADMKPFTAKIQKKMLDFKTEMLLINGSHLATWKIDARGAKRFILKELKEDKKIKDVA
ncbi:YqaJ viral recombinase family protein [Fusobacterium ulcerans]|uniref:YqaJ viral recombinase family protein n=1 Tax=Fusobacterium ulcerans TaxID=861 RepID=UPI0027BA2843|nr:YqaJ viral recombinase family protein [Fusobacterium ulcerans]